MENTSTLGASAPAVFNFQSHEVRTFKNDGLIWFSAADVCVVLHIKNYRDSLMHLDADEKGVVSTDTLGGQQQISVVNESGLYALVLRSRKPEARKFAKWVTSEVLPSIRKTGSYNIQQGAEDIRSSKSQWDFQHYLPIAQACIEQMLKYSDAGIKIQSQIK